MITETRRAQYESLIDDLSSRFGMAREVAITALTIKDQKLIQAGRSPQIAGASFEAVYPADDVALHEDDVAKIVSFLEAVSYDRAKELTAQRITSGLFKAETKH